MRYLYRPAYMINKPTQGRLLTLSLTAESVIVERKHNEANLIHFASTTLMQSYHNIERVIITYSYYYTANNPNSQ